MSDTGDGEEEARVFSSSHIWEAAMIHRRGSRLAAWGTVSVVLFISSLPVSAAGDDEGVSQVMSPSNASEYHYEPVPGRLVGVWPDSRTVERLTELRTRYGFRSVVVRVDLGEYQAALDAGFLPENIMVQLWGGDYLYAMDNLDAAYYFLDEPVEHDCAGNPSGAKLYSLTELQNILSYLWDHRPNSQFVISGYKRCSHNRTASNYAHLMMYPSYHNWNSAVVPTCYPNMGYGDALEAGWLPGDDDQRDSWSDMRNTFGSKFSMAWINGAGDEYDNLFGHGSNLGLTGLWMYNSGPIDPARLEQLCTAATKHGWMTRVEGPPLAVTLVSFHAWMINGHTVHTEWETISEIYNYGFYVQRLRRGTTDFEDIPGGFVAGHGTTAETHRYEFTDTTVTRGRWWYRLRMVDLQGVSTYSDARRVDILTKIAHKVGILTTVDEPQTPGDFQLLQNYPNPFNPSTRIEFALPVRSHVVLSVYNVLGESIDGLIDSELPSGIHSVEFDATNLPGGVYFYRLRAQSSVSGQAGTFTETKMLVLTR